MADDNKVMDNLLAEIKQQGARDAKQVNFLAKSDEEQKIAFNELKNGFMEGLGVSNDIAEEMANAYVDEAKAVNKAQEYQMAADKMAQMRGQAQLGKLDELKTVMSSKLGDLGTALSDDFKQITGGLNMIAEAPGIKSLVAIVTTIAGSLGTVVLLSLKRNLAEDNFFGKRIKLDDKGGVDLLGTLKNFNPLAGVMTPGDPERKGGEFNPEKPKQDWKNANRDEKGQFKKMSMVDEFKFTFANAMGDANEKMKESLKESGAKLWKSTEGLRDNAFTRGLSKVGKTMADAGKRLLKGAVRLAASSLAFVAGMMMTAITLIAGAVAFMAPYIAIALAVAAIVFGILWLANNFHKIKDKLYAGWEMIKIGFQNAIDGLIFWKDKAVAGIQNIFKKISLGIQNMMVSILEGIEGAINWVIREINGRLGWAGVNLDEVDIGASGMRASFDEDKAAFEIEKQNQSEEFAKRQKDIDDQRSNNTMERAMTVVQQNNNTVNEASSTTTIVPTGTEPQDSFASNMALAQ